MGDEGVIPSEVRSSYQAKTSQSDGGGRGDEMAVMMYQESVASRKRRKYRKTAKYPSTNWEEK
jgi:hypothetical protein